MERLEMVFEWLARGRNVTVEEMRAYISARIAEGCNSPDPARREQWRRIPMRRRKIDLSPDIPTPDDWEV